MVYELQLEYDDFKMKKNWRQGVRVHAWLKRADRFMQFVMDNFKPDVTVMAVRLAVNNRRLPFHTVKMENFMKFATKHRNVVIG